MLPPTINYEYPDPGVRPRLHPERGAPRRRPRRDVELVRLRRPQRLDRPQALRGLAATRAMADRWATFDCYGTLIDWNGGIRRELARLFGDGARRRLLERYHELEPRGPGRGARALLPRGDDADARASSARPAERARRARRRSLPVLAAVPRGARRARGGARRAAGGSRSSRTPTATSSRRRRRGSACRST